MHKALVNIKENKFIDKSVLTVRNLLEVLLEEQEKANKIKDTTLLRNKQTAKIINKMYIADMPIQKVTAIQLNDCLLGIVDYSNSYIEKIYMLLSAVFNKAMLLQIINMNPFLIKGNIIKPKSKKKDKTISAFSIEEQRLFIQQLQKRNYKYSEIFIILLYTGMRVGELLSLRRDDCDFKKNTIHIKRSLTKDKQDKVKLGDTTKTYSGDREIPMNSIVKKILQKNMSIDFLFLQPNGKFIAPSTINAHFKRICKDAGIRPCIYVIHRKGRKNPIKLKSSNVNTHITRHSYSTRAIESGMKPVVLQRILRTFFNRNNPTELIQMCSKSSRKTKSIC